MEKETCAKKEKESEEKFDSFIRDMVLGTDNDKLVVASCKFYATIHHFPHHQGKHLSILNQSV